MKKKWNLLYFYAERHPKNLRELVYESIPKNEFEVKAVNYNNSVDELCEKMKWSDIVLLAPARKIPSKVFEHAKNVKLMQIWSAGYDKFNIQNARKYKIPVANNGGANKISVAEHTILLMLAVYKKLPESHARTVEGRWAGNSHGMDMFMLHRKTVGIIGLGNIGREVAKRVSGFDTNIIYYDIKKASVETEQKLNCTYVPFEKLIKESDIISLHLHLNEDTRGVIGKKEISIMKKNAVVINVSRAELIDNRELCKALYDKRIWGAGFDVYETEPTNPGDPLLNHPNVVATPHMAHSYDSHKIVLKVCIENLLRIKRGEEALWRVD